jgi:hypothetical protein
MISITSADDLYQTYIRNAALPCLLNNKSIKPALIILTGFVAVTAGLCGLLLILYPNGSALQVPLEVLQFTPFRNFIIPGIILMLGVGGINISATISLIKDQPRRLPLSMWAGLILCGWLIVQVLLIRAVNMLHLVYGLLGLIIMTLSWLSGFVQHYPAHKRS